jgi:NAD(P)-dependent dehydrogenase (short-subunit alcohol dehydrogenase family)
MPTPASGSSKRHSERLGCFAALRIFSSPHAQLIPLRVILSETKDLCIWGRPQCRDSSVGRSVATATRSSFPQNDSAFLDEAEVFAQLEMEIVQGDEMASVLITGTSKGIGLETALAFGRAGHDVYATMRNPAQSPQLADAARREKLPVKISAMDVDSDESVRDGIAAIYKDHGQIDVLVNNAGVERSGSVEELPLADFRAAMETNYFGVIRCIQAVAPHMRQRRSGRIVNVTSIGGRITLPPTAAYNASKFALEGLSESLAAEMKTFNVRVAIVEPGIIDTSMPHRIANPSRPSAYPQEARVALLFEASLKNAVSPSFVAQKILEIAESDSWQLRYPVGPDAEPFLQWRRSMTDEEWVDLNASDDETWYARIEHDFGMNTRPGK